MKKYISGKKILLLCKCKSCAVWVHENNLKNVLYIKFLVRAHYASIFYVLVCLFVYYIPTHTHETIHGTCIIVLHIKQDSDPATH